MASGQTTNLGLPQIIGTDLVNSSDINNGFYKIDEHAGVLNAKISKLETESGGSSEELENVNNTISEVRGDITTIESSVNTNTQDIVLLKRHQNESDARIDALEGASGGGGKNIKIVTVRIPSKMSTSAGYNLKNVPLSWNRSDYKEIIKSTFDFSNVDQFEVMAIIPYIKRNITVTITNADNIVVWSGHCDVHLDNFSLIGTDVLNSVKFFFLERVNGVPTYLSDSILEAATTANFGASIDVQFVIWDKR